MANKRQKKLKLTSPKGVFKYPNLTRPDTGTKDYPKPDGEFNVRLILNKSDPATASFLAKLQPHYDAAKEKAEEAFGELKVATRKKLGKLTMNDLYTVLYDPETEEETGEIEFRFKAKASGTRKDNTKWERTVDLFDAHGAPITKKIDIWGGTTGIISFTFDDYFIPGTGTGGMKLQLEAAQIVELVQGGQRSADSYGFASQGEGYAYSDDDAVEEDTDGDVEDEDVDDANDGADEEADDEEDDF